MKNCDKDIRAYHREEVALTSIQRGTLKDRRDSNRKRLRSGLEKRRGPSPIGSVSQGSYAMRTVTQEPNNAYDIDDGVVFDAATLKGPRGAERSALDVRKMVCAAVHSDAFVSPPEVKTNCVRVFYNDGPHVDIPVYRQREDWSGEVWYELASSDWKKSDPNGVNDWFKNWLDRNRSSERRHSRELIRLLKSFCKNRPSYSLPSGFVITTLVKECYDMGDDRLDIEFLQIAKRILDLLGINPYVRHPVVVGEWIIDAENEHQSRNLCKLLERAVDDLAELDLPNCTRSKALKAWKKVFHTNFFDKRIAEAEKKEKTSSKARIAALISAPKPYASKGYEEIG
ncbi:MAG: hypothetical protein OXN97_09905 [Bryobacterales bacterium]|nr:hypothetical protein [Bryobacterales bacterium]